MKVALQPQVKYLSASSSHSPASAMRKPPLRSVKAGDLATLLVPAVKKDFKSGGLVITPQANALAGKLYEAKLANVFSKEWMTVVQIAREANGGLGDPTQGYLAWSKEGHFVRLNNPRLTSEQNRQLAEISMLSGIAIEDLPSRWETQSTTDPKVNEKLNSFILDFQNQLGKMLSGQSESLNLKDKKHIYLMQFDKNSGYAISDHQKQKNWFQRLAAKGLRTFGKPLSYVAKYAGFIPGWGTIAAAGASALNWAMYSIATGKAKLEGLVSSAVKAASSAMGSAMQTVADSALSSATDKILDKAVESLSEKGTGGL